MSAFLVSKDHIDAMVRAGLSPRHDGRVSWHYGGFTQRLDYTNTDIVGRMLWTENLRSIHALYPDTVENPEHMPGPIGITPELVDGYVYSNPRTEFSLVARLKLIDCYVYQACEHPEWEASEANTFCQALRRHLIRKLPGYDDAPWGI